MRTATNKQDSLSMILTCAPLLCCWGRIEERLPSYTSFNMESIMDCSSETDRRSEAKRRTKRGHYGNYLSLACMQTSPISFVALGKGRLRDGVGNRVPVSCCSGFKFRINYETLSAKQLNVLNCDHLCTASCRYMFFLSRSTIAGLTRELFGITYVKLVVLTRIEESTPASYDRSVKKKLNIV